MTSSKAQTPPNTFAAEENGLFPNPTGGSVHSGSVTHVGSVKVIREALIAGPKMSDFLIQRLQEHHQITPAAARQRLRRSASAAGFATLEKLSFENRSKVYHLTGMPVRAYALRNAVPQNSACFQILDALCNIGWVAHIDRLRSGGGLPVQSKAVASFDSTLAGLEAEGVLVRRILESGVYIHAREISEDELQTKLIKAERDYRVFQFVRSAVVHRFEKLRLLQTPRTHGANNQVFGVPYDVTAKGYLLAYLGGDGWLGIDIQTGHVSNSHLKSFARKVERTTTFAKQRFQPVLVGRSFSQRVLESGNRNGWMFITHENVYGRRFAELILALESGEIINAKPEQLREFAETAIDQPKESSLRGLALELLVLGWQRELGVKESGWSEVRFVNIKDTTEKVEIDVWATRLGKVHCFECKSSKNPLSFQEVQDWWSRQVPRILKTFENQKVVVHLVAVSGFDKESQAFIGRQAPRKFEVEIWDGAKLLAALPSNSFKEALKKIMRSP